MCTPLNKIKGTRNSNPQALDLENSHPKNEFSTSFHNLEPSMGQELLKEVPKFKEWPDFSCEGEYYGIKLIRHSEMIEEDFESSEILVTETFNTFFPKSAHRSYIKLRQGHQHQSWNWWKTQIINIWANYSWRFKGEKAFEYAKFNADKGKSLPRF
ncbi:hypothetical protein O181_025508 [Austropuccinia psidii MF-1]|uniref:Uncharacterized protein n=1 Tax=Austropuccinia psidii MF-1 TaxID=1389203 RepID=A0A9Q3CKT0_9BASI|nr:hypothetical protein [Austropuccinia psidii MF-1]